MHMQAVAQMGIMRSVPPSQLQSSLHNRPGDGRNKQVCMVYGMAHALRSFHRPCAHHAVDLSHALAGTCAGHACTRLIAPSPSPYVVPYRMHSLELHLVTSAPVHSKIHCRVCTHSHCCCITTTEMYRSPASICMTAASLMILWQPSTRWMRFGCRLTSQGECWQTAG